MSEHITAASITIAALPYTTGARRLPQCSPLPQPHHQPTHNSTSDAAANADHHRRRRESCGWPTAGLEALNLSPIMRRIPPPSYLCGRVLL
ncbi:hypothetical protein BaRGS_00039563 [Batillaria attramentaria]|uniref:Uncharacterized protein n=1 Tax=Batillaria attramentaria TaxID=370345 RepID=A0ABD0J2R3_9CAEN